MLDSLKALLFGGEAAADSGGHSAAKLQRAAAGLLVEAALMDGHFAEAERTRIAELLTSRFELSTEATDGLIASAEAAADENVEIYTITKIVRDHFDDAERVRMIEMLWEVVYADSELDDFEANMMRRVAGLLYVTDQESGAARKRVLQRRGH